MNTENTPDTQRQGRVGCEVTQEAPRLRGTDPGGRGGESYETHRQVRSFVDAQLSFLSSFHGPPLFLYLRLFLEVCASTSSSWIMNSARGFVALLRVEIRYVRRSFVLFHSNLERTHTDQKRQTQTHMHLD